MKQLFFLIALTIAFTSCKKEEVTLDTSTGLKRYVNQNASLVRSGLIACAGGTTTSFLGDDVNPISVFFYLEEGASDFRYFETDSINVDNADYRNYEEKKYSLTDLFGGVMKKFDHPPLSDERWGIVTFKTEDKLHICNPIRLKASVAETADISSIIQVTDNGVTPNFDWASENEPNNVIYFSMVSTTSDSLISGTYTYDKFWTFYDLSNVVLNVTAHPNPMLLSTTPYNYTLMGVSVDNWVHTFGMKPFVTQ